jgi:nucleotide-binding universal stress UspA family protein
VDDVLAEAQGVVEELAGSARALALTTRTHTSIGDAASEIVAYAADQRIDLIVMATTGRTGLAHVLLGSVAEWVVRHATCPVLTVRHDGAAAPAPLLPGALPQLRRILVPLDGSELAESVLPHLVTLASRHGAHVTLLRVTHAHALRESELVEAQVRVVQEAETYLAGVERRLVAEGVRTSPVVRYGEAAEEILDDIRSRRPDLVAMSTHGRTGLK